jgi:hypothetical protein
MTRRASIYTLLLMAFVAWGGLLLFTRFVPPQSLLAFCAFFLLLAIALTGTFSPLAYVVGLRVFSLRHYRATLRHAIRQGILLSLVIVLNLILRALHSWSIFAAIVIVVVAVVLEVLSLARKSVGLYAYPDHSSRRYR